MVITRSGSQYTRTHAVTDTTREHETTYVEMQNQSDIVITVGNVRKREDYSSLTKRRIFIAQTLNKSPPPPPFAEIVHKVAKQAGHAIGDKDAHVYVAYSWAIDRERERQREKNDKHTLLASLFTRAQH